jgi:hypothetical protein
MVLVAGLVIDTGGGAAPVVAPVVQTVATTGAAGASSAGAVAAAVDVAIGVSKSMAVVAANQAAIASGVAVNAAIAGTPALVVGGTGGAATTAATTVAAANSWNPVGWMLGAVLVGADQCAPRTVTRGCYKPIIGEGGNEAMSAEPITFAALAGHPKVQRVSVGACAASAGFPEVEVGNTAGEHYLLRGVALPWGGAAYHAERVDNGTLLLIRSDRSGCESGEVITNRGTMIKVPDFI